MRKLALHFLRSSIALYFSRKSLTYYLYRRSPYRVRVSLLSMMACVVAIWMPYHFYILVFGLFLYQFSQKAAFYEFLETDKRIPLPGHNPHRPFPSILGVIFKKKQLWPAFDESIPAASDSLSQTKLMQVYIGKRPVELVEELHTDITVWSVYTNHRTAWFRGRHTTPLQTNAYPLLHAVMRRAYKQRT